MRLLLVVVALALAACADDAPSPASTPTDAVPSVRGTATFADDGADDPGFAAFRDTLRAVVARRDTAALLATVAPGARLSFGDAAGGPDGFRAMWFAGAPPAGVPVWDLLGALLDAGSVDEDGAVTIPASAMLWPDSLDAYGHVAVLGTDVPARASATDTTVVARLTRVYLPRAAPSDGITQSVRLPDGRVATVPAPAATSPVGWRATFWDDGDGWRLQSFLAGD